MIITIGGVPGSGKTTVAKLFATKHNMAFYSVGGLRAKLAHERGVTIDELNAIGETDKTTDTTVDDEQRRMGVEKDQFIIEGRLSWYFIPQSIKIFFTCDPLEGAKRVFYARQTSNDRSDEPVYASAEEAGRAIADRMASDARRYAKWYGVDYLDLSHYDLVIDTTHLDGPEATLEAVERALESRNV